MRRSAPTSLLLTLGLLASSLACGGRSVPREPERDAGQGDGGALPDGGGSGNWEGVVFSTAGTPRSGCRGNRFVRRDMRTGLWVGAELCSAQRYKLYLGPDREGPYYPVGDTLGAGEDHCQLVKSSFTLPNETNIKTGCSRCALGPTFRVAGISGYVRAKLDEGFSFNASFRADTSSNEWLECDATIP